MNRSGALPRERGRRASVPEQTVAFVLLVVAELVILAVAQGAGGMPWTVLVALALLVESIGGLSACGLAGVASALAWVVAFRVTGNRELFFPFTMHLAAHVGLRLAERDQRVGMGGGALMVVVFLAFRVMQRATPRVLVVEAAVATAILAALFALHRLVVPSRHGVRDVALTVAASLAAYAGLAL